MASWQPVGSREAGWVAGWWPGGQSWVSGRPRGLASGRPGSREAWHPGGKPGGCPASRLTLGGQPAETWQPEGQHLGPCSRPSRTSSSQVSLGNWDRVAGVVGRWPSRERGSGGWEWLGRCRQLGRPPGRDRKAGLTEVTVGGLPGGHLTVKAMPGTWLYGVGVGTKWKIGPSGDVMLSCLATMDRDTQT